MHRGVKVSLSLVSLVAIALLVYAYFPTSQAQSDAAPNKSDTPKPVPVHVITVQQGAISQQTTATGDILAAAKVGVFSKVEGRIRAFGVEQGDTVQAGQVIAQIDDAELKARRERAVAELDALRAAWAQMQAGALPEEIAQAEDQVQRTQAELANSKRLLERTHAMVERGLQSTQELEDATLHVAQAQASHNIAEKRLVLLRAGARVEDRQALQARLRAAQAALRLAEAELQNTVITAPITGVVSHRHVDPGAYIADNTIIVTIVDMQTVKISAPISERDIGAIRPGMSARIRVDAYPQETFTGAVQRVSPTIDPASRSGEVEIVVSNSDYRLKPGMFAKVTLIIQQKHDVVVIPRAALRTSAKGAAVFVVADGKAHLRPVTLGLQNDTDVEILDALTPGTDIILAGHHGLKDQAFVKVVQAKE